MSTSRTKFPDILKIAFNSFMENVHTAIPGTIQSYDASKKKVSVKPSIKKKLNNEILSYPTISEVPIIFPSTKDSIVAFPLSIGDGGLILFSEVSLERYLSSFGEEVEPGENRKFALSDAVFIPGLFPFGNPGAVGDGINMQIKFKTTEIQISPLGFMTLVTGDASFWQPNILTNDPITGIPHGGTVAGIVKLKGG